VDERPPPSATTTMQTYVYQLRKATRQHDRNGPDLGRAEGHDDSVKHDSIKHDSVNDDRGMLHTSFGGYMLTLRPEALDALRFEQLVEDGRGRLAAGELAAAAWTFRLALQQWKGPALTAINVGPVLQAAAVRLEEMPQERAGAADRHRPPAGPPSRPHLGVDQHRRRAADARGFQAS